MTKNLYLRVFLSVLQMNAYEKDLTVLLKRQFQESFDLWFFFIEQPPLALWDVYPKNKKKWWRIIVWTKLMI
jgi:hypothetical protein